MRPAASSSPGRPTREPASTSTERSMSPRKALVLALLAAASARAGGDSTTLFDSRPFVRDGGHQDNSIYEAFSLNARAEGNDWLQDIRVVARGWGRLTLGTSFDEHTTAGDVDSLFFEGRVLQRHLLLRAGRQEQGPLRSEEHTYELQSPCNLVCRLLLEKKKHTSELQSPSILVCSLLLETQRKNT